MLRRSITTFEGFRLYDRMILIFTGIIVGVCSGLAALLLNRSLEMFLDVLHPYRQYWWAFIFPGVGAALSSLFLNRVVNEGAGHGVPEVIYAVSRYGGLLRFRSSISRLVSSLLTIGSGGSAGPEAPVVMSGSAIGSNFAKWLGLNERQRITLVGCGAAGAIASIFNAPIAGMVFSMEVILGEWKSSTIIPIGIAAAAGAEVSRLLKGIQIVFDHRSFRIDLLDIVSCIGLALLTALASILLTRFLRFMHKRSERIFSRKWVRAMAGGIAVGVIGLFFPVVLGEGYHFIDLMIEGSLEAGLVVTAIFVLAKILATSFTLGWGGSGGIFAPALVVGSLVGVTYHGIISLVWPGVSWVEEGCFALLGMAGLISGMLQAPLTGVFLIFEITGGYEVILPLIMISAISTALCHYIEPASFYLKELIDKGQLLRPGTDARVLSDLKISELIETDCMTVKQNMPLGEFVEIVKLSHRNHFPVESEKDGRFVGMVHLDDVREYLFSPELYDVVVVGQIMNPYVETVHPDDDLVEVLSRMDSRGLFSMPVVSEDHFFGMISKATLLDQYRKELIVQTEI